MDYLDPSDEIDRHGRDLPHWQQGESMQFVTFRLCDSMPSSRLRRWKEERIIWMRHHPPPWRPEEENEYHRRFTWKFEEWLDEGAGGCLFRDPCCREIVERVLMHSQCQKVEHHAWVIMPNHLHLLFTPHLPLEILLKAWKGVSARNIGRGRIWQRNYRDTMIRDGEHFANVIRYIRKNPAKLPSGTYTLWQGPRALAVSESRR